MTNSTIEIETFSYGQIVTVDAIDYMRIMNAFFNKLKPRLYYDINTKYIRGVFLVNGEKQLLTLHRFIINEPRNILHIDHINRNTLDNRRCNLRVISHGENLTNSPKRAGNNSSKYKGVVWCKQTKKWRVDIKVNRKSKYIGRFKDEKEAALAYNKYAALYYPGIAYLNVIE